jgi:hypothetical protein
MDQERTLDTAELRASMEATRVSLRETVHELKGRVGETMDWRTYLDRYPGVTLVGAAVLGAVVGRAVGSRMGDGREHAEPAGGYLMARSESAARSGGLAVMRDSWSRAGSRLEGIVNRVIDEVADLVEHSALPAMMSRLRAVTHLDRPSGSNPPDFTFHATNR